MAGADAGVAAERIVRGTAVRRGDESQGGAGDAAGGDDIGAGVVVAAGSMDERVVWACCWDWGRWGGAVGRVEPPGEQVCAGYGVMCDV